MIKKSSSEISLTILFIRCCVFFSFTIFQKWLVLTKGGDCITLYIGGILTRENFMIPNISARMSSINLCIFYGRRFNKTLLFFQKRIVFDTTTVKREQRRRRSTQAGERKKKETRDEKRGKMAT